jgi:hypothetical protein
MRSSPRVFVSMGSPYTKDWVQFRDELEGFLRDGCGVDPRIIGKNEYPSGSPLEHIRTTMRTCAGVVIVAYERKYVKTGVEKRGSEKPEKLEDRTYTTPWNHIESAIAYSLGLPIYILCQRGLHQEGLIESKNDWWVQPFDTAPGALSRPELVQSMRAWVNARVIPTSNKSNVIESLQGRVKLSEMTPHELWSFFGMIATVFLIGTLVGPYVPVLPSFLTFLHDHHLLP